MYNPAVNSGAGETAPPWNCQMTDHSFQVFQIRQPVGIHRCVSQPFLGGGYNYPTSPTELQQLGVHHRIQSQNMMPDSTCLYGCGYPQPYLGMVTNPNFKNLEASHCGPIMARELQDLKIGDYEQGNSKIAPYREVMSQQCELPPPKREIEDWQVEETVDWKKKYERVKKELTITKEYLKDLNTKEDNLRMKMELHKSEDRKHNLELRITELESDVRKFSKRLSDKELYINHLEHKNSMMKMSLGRAKSEPQKLKDGKKKSMGKDLQEVAAERDEILQQFEQVKRMLAVEKSLNQDLQQKNKKEVQELKENLSKEKASVKSLNNNMILKENKLDNFKSQMKKIQAHEQLLMEELSDLQEQVKHHTDANTACEERNILSRQLLKEMAASVYELRNLVDFCIKDHNGEDMNVSLIVGTRAPPNPVATLECYADSEKFLSFQLREVKKLRQEIQKLQETLTNSYAIRVGSQLRL